MLVIHCYFQFLMKTACSYYDLHVKYKSSAVIVLTLLIILEVQHNGIFWQPGIIW